MTDYNPVVSCEACASLPQETYLDLFFFQRSSSPRSAFQYIRATGALHGSGALLVCATSSSDSSIICAISCSGSGSGSGSGSSVSCTALLCFRPRFLLPVMTFSAVCATSGSSSSASGSSASSAALLRFRPRFPLPFVASFAARFFRASSMSS
ncbi:hypothetical protein B0O99DRAFT_84783 [Bisporella sp. PMI_857]|nr:hypothetical protein B0O99DRAFT_84783 [Bisporella sp. PMI_857]